MEHKVHVNCVIKILLIQLNVNLHFVALKHFAGREEYSGCPSVVSDTYGSSHLLFEC